MSKPTFALLEVDTGPAAESGKQYAIIRGIHSNRIKASMDRARCTRLNTKGRCVRFEVRGICTALRVYEVTA